MERLKLLVSDVDHTLIGDDDALTRFVNWYEEARGWFRLALNSGRFFSSVLESTRETPLPLPDAFIGGVGTEICFPPNGRALPHWPKTGGMWDADLVRLELTSYDKLELQPEEFQSPFKVSVFGANLNSGFLEHLQRRFTELHLSVNIIYSSGLHLDVLPAGVHKGSAIGRLIEHWEIQPEDVIVAGDSGNDATMFHAGYRGIVVANAHSELKALRGPNVYHARQAYADGVLEGLNHWLTAPIELEATRATADPSIRDRDAGRGMPV